MYYGMNYSGDKPGYYRISDKQWTYCNMTAIAEANGDFISACANVGGGWRRIANINISAEDCLREWRKATQSGVSFCRVASDRSRLTVVSRGAKKKQAYMTNQ